MGMAGRRGIRERLDGVDRWAVKDVKPGPVTWKQRVRGGAMGAVAVLALMTVIRLVLP